MIFNLIRRNFTTQKIQPGVLKMLRQITGSPIQHCKTALEKNDFDIEKAKAYLKEKGLSSAENKLGKQTREGVVSLYLNQSRKLSIMAEINCETDFVAKTDQFLSFSKHFVENLARDYIQTDQNILELTEQDQIENFLQQNSFKDNIFLEGQLKDSSIDETRKILISKIQENVNIRRFCIYSVGENQQIGAYIHNSIQSNIGYSGAMTILNGKINNSHSQQLADNLSIQILGMKPPYLFRSDVPQDILKEQKEEAKQLLGEQLNGKPEKVQEKMIEGKMKKFFEKNVLMDQNYILDPDDKLSIAQLIKDTEIQNNDSISIHSFKLFSIK